MAESSHAESSSVGARTIFLSKWQTDACVQRKIGGKARGIVRLMQLDLSVPPAFVVTHVSACELPDFERYCAELATNHFAVRSSMLEEDGDLCSFAGQFETFLHVEGVDAVRKAVADCFASAQSVRSTEYWRRQAEGSAFGQNAPTAVIVQRMVHASKAGVLFSVDPVTQFRDRIVIEVVAGVADRLVGGRQNAAAVLQVSRTGKILQARNARDANFLTPTEIEMLVSQALRAEAAQGVALDLEWAIDEDGMLHWLQMRPITTLNCDPGEFDTPGVSPTAVLTRGNVGEILPGALTPLTLSTSVAAIEMAMQRSFVRANLPVAALPSRRVFKLCSGHLFIDLSEMVRFATVLIGTREENFIVPLCGGVPSEIPRLPRVSWWRRVVGSVRFFVALLRAPWRISAFARRVENETKFAAATNLLGGWHGAERIFKLFQEACDLHLMVSFGSGAMHGVLVQFFSWRGVSAEIREREIADLLRHIEGVDEISVVLDKIFATLRAQENSAKCFFQAELRSAQTWLSSDAAGHASVLFANFIQCHGHRGFNEFEMSAPSWRMDSLPLLAALRARWPESVGRAMSAPNKELDFSTKMQRFRHILLSIFCIRHFARVAVRNRERTKSLSVRVAEQLKIAYQRLGQFLVDAGVLARAEDIAFLTHAEIGMLVAARACTRDARVDSRRRALAIQRALAFPSFNCGKPEAFASDLIASSGTPEVLRGQTVSRGCVTGIARVVANPDALQQRPDALMPFCKNEILIAQAIDIAWVPYFACVAGLATEMGSAVSHGAVLAREYGLPAVVSLRNATQRFQTGEWVTLDADHGILRRALPEERRACERLPVDLK